MQSPKSQRSKGPGEKPASDGNTQTDMGGTHPEGHAAGSPQNPSVPAGLQHQGGRHQGNVEAESAVPTHPSAPHQGGGPKYSKDKGDGSRKGGTVHQT